MRITCPHCGQLAKIRTSREITPTTREAYVQCKNVQCCHVWKILIGAVTTIIPPLVPNPAVYIHPSRKPHEACERQLPLLDRP